MFTSAVRVSGVSMCPVFLIDPNWFEHERMVVGLSHLRVWTFLQSIVAGVDSELDSARDLFSLQFGEAAFGGQVGELTGCRNQVPFNVGMPDHWVGGVVDP